MHFTSAILTKEKPNYSDIEDLMAPYQENNFGSTEPQYLVFCDMTEEVTERYNTDGEEVAILKDGTTTSIYNSKLYWAVSEEEYKEARSKGIRTKIDFFEGRKIFMILSPERIGAEVKYMPFKEIYKDVDEFAREEYNDERDDKGRFGYYENPNSTWDYFSIGGRWNNFLTIPVDCENYTLTDKPEITTIDGVAYQKVNSCRIKDLVNAHENELKRNAAIIWEVHVEGREPKDEYEKEITLWTYSGEYLKRTYETKERYIKYNSMFATYSYIDENGEWTDVSGFPHEIEKLNEILKKADEDDWITIVDCHV